ncbi:MAG TPA: hypothetical protein EYP10_12955, partial [Armatimonadetes bacterium]|nr:hypothetical protein [Armatimonadota bacterium]
IGDYAEDIAKITPIMVEHPVPELLSEIPTLGHMATDMIRNAVKSFVDSDIELAHQVCRDDRPVDRLYRQILKQVVNFLSEQPQAAYPGVYVVLLARRLERTADHATNIAERVHYMVTGKLVQLARVYREEESTLPFGEQ